MRAEAPPRPSSVSRAPMRAVTRFAAAAAAALMLAAPAEAAPTYTVKSAFGNVDGEAFGINDHGTVVGYIARPPGYAPRPVVADQSGLRDIAALAGPTSQGFGHANAISNSGYIAGTISGVGAFGFGQGEAFLYDGTTLRDLGTLPGFTSSSGAFGVDEEGRVVGISYDPGGGRHAFLTDSAGIHDLGVFEGTTASEAYDVENGVAVGRSYVLGGGSGRLFKAVGGSMSPIGEAGGFAYSVNSLGHVVGDLNGLAFFHDGSATVDLGVLPGASWSTARGLNDHGQIVGTSSGRAFLYQEGLMYDLNELLPPGSGWTLLSARDINNRGQIVGTAIDPSGRQVGFLLSPGGDPEAALARDLRPHLLFDRGELWRPIGVDALMAERVDGNPAHQVCQERSLGFDVCEPAPSVQSLIDFALAHPDTDPASPARDNMLDIRGDVRNGRGETQYHAPSLAGCAVPAPLDCDSGANSVMYYNRTLADGLDGTPGVRSYWDYWYFFRYNHFPLSFCYDLGPGIDFPIPLCFEHEGDWEGVTVVTTREPSPQVLWVSYAGHDGAPRRYAADALRAAGRFAGDHIGVYIAKGTHAAYSSPCTRFICWQDRATFPNLPEERHGGEARWSRNDDAQCTETDTCVAPLPEKQAEPTVLPAANADAWADWSGRWGRFCKQGFPDPCRRELGPHSPGHQARYSAPWSTRVPRQAAAAGRRARALARLKAESRCATWFGSDVVALACDEAQLLRSLGARRPARGGLRVAVAGADGSSSWRGLAQVLGEPLRPGARVAITGTASTGTKLSLRVRIAGRTAVARFRLGGGRWSGQARVVVANGGAALRFADGRVLRAYETAVPARAPGRVSAVRGPRGITVSFDAHGPRTELWVAEAARSRIVSRRSVATVAGTRTTVRLRAGRLASHVLLATRNSSGDASWPRRVPIR